MAAHRLLHAQRGVQRSLGMIFMGNGRRQIKQRYHHPALGHIAIILMHSVHHPLQRGVNKRPCFFGSRPSIKPSSL